MIKRHERALAGVGCAVVLALSGTAAAADPATGKNTVAGKVAGGSCGQGVVYLYPYFPAFSGADGNSKIPVFEVPGAGDEHYEARCAGGAFTFANIPDGAYLAGMPGAKEKDLALAAAVTVQGGQTVQVELKPQSNAQ